MKLNKSGCIKKKSKKKIEISS